MKFYTKYDVLEEIAKIKDERMPKIFSLGESYGLSINLINDQNQKKSGNKFFSSNSFTDVFITFSPNAVQGKLIKTINLPESGILSISSIKNMLIPYRFSYGPFLKPKQKMKIYIYDEPDDYDGCSMYRNEAYILLTPAMP